MHAGRWGAPHERPIAVRNISNVKKALVDWGTGHLPFTDVYQIVAGKETKVFANVDADENLCFSLVGLDRTLDLEVRLGSFSRFLLFLFQLLFQLLACKFKIKIKNKIVSNKNEKRCPYIVGFSSSCMSLTCYDNFCNFNGVV